jgi:hypothetical protein
MIEQNHYLLSRSGMLLVFYSWASLFILILRRARKEKIGKGVHSGAYYRRLLILPSPLIYAVVASRFLYLLLSRPVAKVHSLREHHILALNGVLIIYHLWYCTR